MENGWNEKKSEVMYRLARIERSLEQINCKLDGLTGELLILKTRAALIGGILGTVMGGVVTVASALIGG